MQDLIKVCRSQAAEQEERAVTAEGEVTAAKNRATAAEERSRAAAEELKQAHEQLDGAGTECAELDRVRPQQLVLSPLVYLKQCMHAGCLMYCSEQQDALIL